MEAALPYREVLEAADALPLAEQEELMEVLRRRIAEQRRHELAREVVEAEAEFESGNCDVASPDELMREILS
jgi:predicted AAA+ superfamily ATPase